MSNSNETEIEFDEADFSPSAQADARADKARAAEAARRNAPYPKTFDESFRESRGMTLVTN